MNLLENNDDNYDAHESLTNKRFTNKNELNVINYSLVHTIYIHYARLNV